jgi:hypothetical protein
MRLLVAPYVALSVVSVRLAAQERPEVVRGRVTDDSARALAGAAVHVTRGPDRLTLQATSDSAGRWSLRFDPGTGDYLIAVSAVGFRGGRRRVQRQGDERELVADFVMTRDLSVLAAVKVQAKRPERADTRSDRFTDAATGAERSAEGVQGQVSPTLAGDLSAIAATLPGLTLTPSGLSVLGTGAESNLNTLNGMALPLGTLPRAARLETRVSSAPFDPTRGGFSGANVDTRLGPGDRNFQNRRAFVTAVPAAVQATDAVGRAAGAQTGQFRASLGADGELVRRVVSYNVSLDVSRAATEPATLLSADDDALRRSGVAPDTVDRLVALAAPLGLPVGGGGIPGVQRRDAVTWLGRLDDTRDTLKVRTLTSFAALTRDGALGLAPLSAPSTAARRREQTVGGQLVLRDFVGPGRRVLTETRLSASGVRTREMPYRALPAASVLARSTSAGQGRDVATLALGGSPSPPRDDARWTAEGANETVWFAGGRTHRFKALGWVRADGLRQDPVGNLLGRWSFNSLDDLAAGRAASFTRTLAQPERSGTAWNAAAALAHQWNRSRTFNVLYGARVEAGGFAGAPAGNPALEQALGVATGVAPVRLRVSPRLGFSWTYSRLRNNGNTGFGMPIGSFNRGPAGVIRGGIGEFRDLVRPGVLADARAATGLPGGTETLSCVGVAVPVPDWRRLLDDPDAIPTRCADGTGVAALSERAPGATLIDRNWAPPRSWRASLDWSTVLGRFGVRANALATYDLDQPGMVEANFDGQQRLTLGAAEGGRPLFVSAAGVDAGTGAVSAAESRGSATFGRVGVRTSDLRGYGGQMTVQVAPSLRRRADGRPGFPRLYTELAYTLQGTRRQFRGFDGAAFGDPRLREWAPAATDARHVVVAQLGTSGRRVGTVTAFGRFQSGLPFTPLVQGDVNGDGRGLDRAFVPDAAGGGDPALAAQLGALTANGAPAAVDCVRRFAGRVAARNRCRGPWTQTLNLRWVPPLPRKWMGRATASLYAENLLGAADRALHGDAGLRGWGVAAAPDPVLLVPRAFDAAAPGGARFRYDVNPRFADTRAANTLLRAPFRLTLDVQLDLSVRYPLQQLRRALEPVRAPDRSWQRRSADSITAFYLGNTSSVPRAVLAESDSLFLSPQQIAAFRAADSAFTADVRAIYRPLGAFLATRTVPGKIELDSVTVVEKAYWKLAWRTIDVADSLLTPLQRELIPFVKGMASAPRASRENSRFFMGYPVPFADSAATKPR